MRIARGFSLLLGLALSGCSGPDLDMPLRGSAGPAVDFDPVAADGAVPLVFRARVRDAPVSGVPWLFRGELSDYYVRAFKRGEVPSALGERAVALRFWRDGADCWAQPVEWLEPAATYSLAVTGLGVVRVVQTQATSLRRGRRVFPPAGSQKYRVSVFCDVEDAELHSPLTLEPGGLLLQVSAGMAGKPGAGCITLQVEGALTEVVVSPPQLAGALFDPSPWLPQRSPLPSAPQPACRAGAPFHGACLEVLDDRVRVASMAQDSLFVLDEPQRTVLAVRAGERGLLARGLLPSSQLSLAGSVLFSTGETQTFRASVTTVAARRHLVLNEVLANPVGLEPGAEWVELVNDSEQPASLAGLWLEDSGGHVLLPDAELAPGEIAVVVSDAFRASGLDLPIPEAVRLLRVPSLGARGLSNGGEALLLVGREGVLSRFPLVAAPHAGRSIGRRTLDGADDDPAGFAEHGGRGASPGAPNELPD